MRNIAKGEIKSRRERERIGRGVIVGNIYILAYQLFASILTNLVFKIGNN